MGGELRLAALFFLPAESDKNGFGGFIFYPLDFEGVIFCRFSSALPPKRSLKVPDNGGERGSYMKALERLIRAGVPVWEATEIIEWYKLQGDDNALEKYIAEIEGRKRVPAL